ncbi:hypothetical protein COMA2_170016 [Candidatus Nitrospira nitrificans]|uniref:Uncharacterized protein n=1 Tax=Candidatus Nitrospira nitrificans TaxID=1742973 RepID=A0A0S4LCJ7_9BACT|nr:hypothetical protein COMA2_170016 [Candidatus Nitrospira nitrificans]
MPQLLAFRQPFRVQTYQYPSIHRRQQRQRERSGLSSQRLPANSIQDGYGYKDRVAKPAEVRRPDVVGPAAAIPY